MLADTLVALLTVATLTSASVVKPRDDVDLIRRWGGESPTAVTVTITEPCSAAGEAPTTAPVISAATSIADTTNPAGTPVANTELPPAGAPSLPPVTAPSAAGGEAPPTSIEVASAAGGTAPVPASSVAVVSSAPTGSVSSSAASVTSTFNVITPTGSVHPTGTASTVAPPASTNAGVSNGATAFAIVVMAAHMFMGVA